jgi:hypothetical protein
MKKQIVYEDASFTLDYTIFGGDPPTVDIACRLYQANGLTLEDFVALIYNSSINDKAKQLDPAVLGADGILRAG